MARSEESRRTEQITREPGDNEIRRQTLSDVSTTPSVQMQMAPLSVRLIDRESNTSQVDIRSYREEVRTDIIHAHSKGIQVPSSSSEFSSCDIDIEEPLRRH